MSLRAKFLQLFGRTRGHWRLDRVLDDPEGPMLGYTCTDPAELLGIIASSSQRLLIDPTDIEARLQRGTCLHCLGDNQTAHADLVAVASSGCSPYAEEAQALLTEIAGDVPRPAQPPGYGETP
jgi:hypothetical protein